MEDIIVVVVIVAIIVLAAYAIYRSKKSGKKCIGCPDSGTCSGNCGCCGGRHEH